MSLSGFVRENAEEIAREWAKFAGTYAVAHGLSDLALRDHILPILKVVAADIEARQSAAQTKAKSEGDAQEQAQPVADIVFEHVAQRMDQGFSLVQTAAEFRALRATVIRLWSVNVSLSDKGQVFDDMTRFNEAIDQALLQSIERFHHTVQQSRELFIATVGHDLRNPLSAIFASGALLTAPGVGQAHIALAGKRIQKAAVRMEALLNDLSDMMCVQRGNGITLNHSLCDLVAIAADIVEEAGAANRSADIRLETSGTAEGDWDKERIARVISNLVGNAVQHGMPGRPIVVGVASSMEEVVLTVHNDGRPIPQHLIATLFDPFVRAGESRGDHKNMGLGLFITKQIVTAHGGDLEVESGAKGTTFTARFPRVED